MDAPASHGNAHWGGDRTSVARRGSRGRVPDRSPKSSVPRAKSHRLRHLALAPEVTAALERHRIRPAEERLCAGPLWQDAGRHVHRPGIGAPTENRPDHVRRPQRSFHT